METETLLHKPRSGGPRTSEEDIERIHQSFSRSLRKSIRTAFIELQVPKSTIHKVLHKKLRLYACKIQLLQALKPDDEPKRKDFAFNILEKMEEDGHFLNRICFSDEATFLVSGKRNKHDARIWETENSHITMEMERDSPKVNVWCGLLCSKVFGSFFFEEKTITANIYLDTLTEYVTPQLEEFQPHVFFQQDGVPPHWGINVREFLDKKFPARGIGRGGPMAWPPRSPYTTPLDFFWGGYVKDVMYRTKVKDISDLKERKTAAVEAIDEEMLKRTWTEIEYRFDILRATNGAHIEIY